MKNLILLVIDLDAIYNFIKKPEFIIAYISVMVVLMVLIVISSMINEHRMSKLADRLQESAAKADKRAADAASEDGASRFEMLKTIDERKKTYKENDFVEDITLKEFCDEFRKFTAGKLKLYYDESTIREFIAGIAVSHFLILQGMSGTGKTSLAFAFGEFLNNPSTIIPVQPMWKERSDMLGYYNEFTKRFNETQLLQKMYEANCRKDIYITVLDELNIARVEYYFAEFLSLMEIPNPESRYLEIISDKWKNDPEDLRDGCIKLPENMWFLGTANNDDSTFAISDKVYDRTMVLDLDSKAEVFEVDSYKTMPVTAKKFNSLVRDVLANNSVSAENLEKLSALDKYLHDKFQVSFGNRIMRQIKSYLPVYVSCGGDELDALDDVLAKKVLRKLEMQNMAYRKTEAEELCGYLNDVFGEDRMKRCLTYIRRIARNS